MQYTVTPSHENHAPRKAAVNALAIVGFIALVFIGIALAIYAARYLPTAISRIGSGLGLANTSGDDGLVVVPSDEPADYDWEVTPVPPVVSTPVTPSTPAAPAKPAAQPIAGYRTVITDYPTPGSTRIAQGGAQNLYGKANLVTRITAVGHVDSRGNNFVEDDSIDEDDRLAVKFTVTNTGTNKTGDDWKVRVTLPTRSDRTFDYTSKTQDNLNPGAKIDFLVYLDKGDTRDGDGQDIAVEADSSDEVDESSESDNRDTAEVDIDD